MWLLFVQVCYTMTSGYEIWWTVTAFVFSTIWSVQKRPPFESKGKQHDFHLRSTLWLSPPTLPPLHHLKLKVEGHSQRLFIEASLMYGLTADISNIKLWAISELYRKPPVSSACMVISPVTVTEMC